MGRESRVGELLWTVRHARLGVGPGFGSVGTEHSPRDGLGEVCERLLALVDDCLSDRRCSEAVTRFFGLNLLPEDQRAIAGSVRRSGVAELGVSTRQVQHLLRTGLHTLDHFFLEVAEVIGAGPHGGWRDPFPVSRRVSQHDETLHQALLWAWAQVPSADHRSGRALLYYELEHGLRVEPSLEPASRTERMRWRRAAWSVLEVAIHRMEASNEGHDPGAVRQVFAGIKPRQGEDLAVLEPEVARLASLLWLYPPYAVPMGLLAEGTELARRLVKQRHADAVELVRALLRVVLFRLRTDKANALPAGMLSKLSVLGVILAKEYRSLSGLGLGNEAMVRNLAGLGSGRGSSEQAILLTDLLRTCQEVAELAGDAGVSSMAAAALEQFSNHLEAFGDPEQESEPNGWDQQLLVTTARLHRAFSRGRDQPEPHIQKALDAARQAAQLAFDHPELPGSWGAEALIVEVHALLDQRERARPGAAGERQRERAAAALGEAEAALDSTRPDPDRLRVRVLMLIAAWRYHLAVGDARRAAELLRELINAPRGSVRPSDLAVMYRIASARPGEVDLPALTRRYAWEPPLPPPVSDRESG